MCLAVGIVIIIITHIYNTKFAYRYMELPIEYEKYEKDLALNTYAEMKINLAVPIGIESTIYREMSMPTVSSIFEGVYYYVVDERGTEGVVFFPRDKIKNGEDYLSRGPLNKDNTYEIDTPLQVYGSIGEAPNFGDSQENAEINEWVSKHAILSVDSLTPLNEEVRVGERISDSWIGIGILLLIAFCVLRPRKGVDMVSH